MSRLISPNEMLAAAKEHMLDNKEPATTDDWALIINFVAHNLDPEITLSVCLLMRAMYEIPLTEDHITKIVEFQLREHN